MNKKILIIIPCYNEEENILKTIKNINEYKKIPLDYVVINDGSTDDTLKVLKENDINFIDLPFNLGIGAAVQTGYKYAYYNGYDIAVQFDGDGQHDINYIDKIVHPIMDGKADMVIGSRFVDDISSFKSTKARQFGINVISGLIKLCSGKILKDVTSGYRAVDKGIIEIFANNYPFDFPEPITNYALLKNNFKVDEVGVNMYERVGGQSSINYLKSIYYMFNVCLSIMILNYKKFGRRK